ncbi:NAD(P)-binding protein, partial [Pyrenochaeta sp. DS3sAY3a]
MDLDSLDSVRKGAQVFLTKSQGKLNVVIGNAGIMATPYTLTKDGFESQFGTCHLAHFLLFHLLKPALLASATQDYPSRYVSVSSSGHSYGTVNLDDLNYKSTPYNEWLAYGQAKTANIWMANSIERHYGAQNLHATSLHPGGIFENSGLDKFIPAEMKAALLGDENLMRIFKSSAQGAATSVYAAVSRE